MKPSAHSSSLALALMLGSLILVGCGGALNFPDSVASTNAAGPPISGSVYGGHAPIQGSHVYLLQPSVTAYGGTATSLLGNNGATSANGYTLTADTSDPNVPVGSEYVTTDALGGFSLTGAYTCVVNQPVYIYAYSGTIGTTSTSTTTTVTYTVSQIVVSGRTTGTTGTATYTFTVSPAETLTAGQTVTISGFPTTGDHFSIIDGAQTVLSGGLTSTTFSFTATDHYTNGGGGNIANGTYTTTNFGTGGRAAATYTTSTTNPAVNNSSIVQLATLGNCPSSGNFSTAGNGALSFVYLSEVSTVATAYTFQPFTLATNNSAWDIGTDGTTQALLGIFNAANTASQLYNIQGGTDISVGANEPDGEGYLANALTAAGNGIVPRATIDSLADILATCVDSTPVGGGGPSAQCTSLFDTATNNGETGTTGNEPTDTGTAAINIARYPAGNNSTGTVNAAYASDLWALQTTIAPFVPNLTIPPNDWTLAISYPVSSTNYGGVSNPWAGLAESIEVDANGDVYVTGQTKDSIVRLDPLGVIDPSTAQNYRTYIPGYVSVDGSNNAYTGSANSSTAIFEAGGNGVFTATYGSGFQNAYVNIADNAGNDYFFAKTTGNYEMFEFPVGSTSTTVPNQYSIATSGFGAANVAHGAIDASHDFWLTSETAPYQIAKVTSTGTNVWLINTGVERPEFPAIDASGNGWIPSQTAAGPIYKITTAGTPTLLSSTGGNVTFEGNSTPTTATGATLSYPFGAAVDGNGNVWVTNRCGAYNNCASGHNAASSTLIEINGSNNQAISPPANYIPETEYPAAPTTLAAIMTDPLNVAIDPSGNIWITNYVGTTGDGEVVEIVGAAAPVITPLSAAAGASKLGTKP